MDKDPKSIYQSLISPEDHEGGDEDNKGLTESLANSENFDADNKQTYQFSLFMQLNEGDTGMMASRDELDFLLYYMKEDQKDAEDDELKKKIDLHFYELQVHNFLDYFQFQELLEKLELTEKAE